MQCPLVFTAALWGLFLPALVPVAGEQSVGLGPVTSQEGPPQLSYPSQFLTATLCTHGNSPPLVPVLLELLYLLSNRTSVH